MLVLAEGALPLFAQSTLGLAEKEESIYHDSLSAKLPDIEQLRPRWGFGARFSYLIPGENFGQYLNTRFGIGLLVNYNIKRHVVSLESSFFGAKTRTDIPLLESESGQSLDLSEWFASYGYRVVNKTFWRITPNVGASLFHLNNSLCRNNYSIDGYGPSAGMQVEYKYKRILKESPKSAKRYNYAERTIGLAFHTSYIISQPYYPVNSQFSYLVRQKGWAYCLSLTWGMN